MNAEKPKFVEAMIKLPVMEEKVVDFSLLHVTCANILAFPCNSI